MIEEIRYISPHERINGSIEYSGILFIHRENNLMYFYTTMFIYSKHTLFFYITNDNLLEVFYYYNNMGNWVSCKYPYTILDGNMSFNKKRYGMLHKNIIINLI